jgi:hypothetical protein
VLTNGIELIAFYEVSALVDANKASGAGATSISDGERIVEQWIQQVCGRAAASPTVTPKSYPSSWSAIFTAQTTAANLAGMGRVMSFKNSMMLTAPRIFV